MKLIASLHRCLQAALYFMKNEGRVGRESSIFRLAYFWGGGGLCFRTYFITARSVGWDGMEWSTLRIRIPNIAQHRMALAYVC